MGDCATLHKAAIAEIAEGKLTSRFGALQDDEDDAEPEAEPPAATRSSTGFIATTLSRAAKGLQTCCAGRMIVDARNVYVVELSHNGLVDKGDLDTWSQNGLVDKGDLGTWSQNGLVDKATLTHGVKMALWTWFF